MLKQSQLGDLMKLYGRTSTQVAAAAGVTEARVRHILTGRNKAKPETIERIELAIVLAGREGRVLATEAIADVA